MAGELRWIFSNEELQNTPSRKAGIDAEKELNYRQQCANLIQDMGQKLQVTQLCINTAIVYMHRFYMFHSFTKFHRNPMGAACLFLAAKVEEQPRKLEHVIKAYHFCVNRDQGQLDVKSEAYLELAQECVINENILLQTLGFSISVEHPHAMVVKTCTLVKASKDLAQTSYFLATNSLHLTTMCLKYSHTVVACVCIHLACKWSNYQIPRSTEGKEWYEYVDRTITKEMLENLTQEFLQILDNCPSKLKKKILTWKSGSRSVEEQNNPGGDASKNKHNHLEATNSPVHTSRHPQPSTSTTADSQQYSQQDPHHHRKTGTPETPSGSMRRVRTEPALAHKEYMERKQRERARMQHGQKAGYHPAQGSGPTHPPPGGAGPTHPPPGGAGPTHPPPASRPTHPPPSRRPPGAPHHPPPGHRGGEFSRPHEDKSSHAASHHAADRRGIFDQIQHERYRSDQPHEQSANTHKSQGTSHPPQGPSAALGAPWHKGQTGQGHVSDKPVHSQSQGHAKGHPGQNADSVTSSAVRDKIQQVLGRSKPGSEKQDESTHSARPPHEQKAEKPPVKKAFSKPNQDNLEKSMLEKLQSEIQKQSALGAAVKNKDQSHKRQSPEKALRSPPPVKRQKSGSSSSKSGSDSTTPKDRIRAVLEIKEKMKEDDQKRLRRMSEELGDGRLLNKPVVLLDDVFTSPENVGISPEKALVSPLAGSGELSANSQPSLLHKTPPKDAIGNIKKELTPRENRSVQEVITPKMSEVQKDLLKEFNVKKEHSSDSSVQSVPAVAHDANKVQNSSGKKDLSSVHMHKTYHKDVKKEPLDSQKAQDPLKIHSKEMKLNDPKSVHNSSKQYEPSKVHGHKQRTDPSRSQVKQESSESHRGGHASVGKDYPDSGKNPSRDVRKSTSELQRTQGHVKKESDPLRKMPEIQKDVTEILKSIGRKEDFLRIGPPRDLVKKETTESNKEATESQQPTASGEAKETTTLVRNRSTISLEKYRERRPLTPSQNVDKSSSIAAVKSETLSKDSSELSKDIVTSKDVITKQETIKSLDSILNSELNDISNSPLAEFTIGSPPKSIHSDAKTLLKLTKKEKLEKIEKLNARIEKPPERISHSETNKVSPLPPPAQAVEAVESIASKANNSPALKINLPVKKQSPVVKQTLPLSTMSPQVEPGEIIDDLLERSLGVDSPRKEKLGLKIKLGGQPVVVASMSPAGDIAGQNSTSQPPVTSSHHHHKEKHKHKHKHKHKRDKERGDRHEKDRKHHREGEHKHKASSHGESSTNPDLKIKLSMKHFSRSDPPQVSNELDPAGTGSKGDGDPGNASSSAAPMKLVLSKDKSGQYSSGHKQKHSSSRKRTHSPVESDRIAAKVPRSDSPASLGNANGSRPGSPSEAEKNRLDRILQSQRKTLVKLKEKPGKSKNKSPVRLPASYQHPNKDV